MRKLTFISAIVLTILLLFSGTAAAAPPEKVDVIIGFDRPPASSEQALVRGFGGEIRHTYSIIPAIAASIPEAAIQGLLRNPRVTVIEPDVTIHAIDAELDNSWGVKRIGAGEVHLDGNKGNGVKVAILDSGIDYDHPELRDNYAGGYDFVNDDDDPMDDNGHGTHVAGTIAALDNDKDGTVVGVAPEVEIYALKVLDANGSGSFSNVIAALNWVCGDYGVGPVARITNNSYGSSAYPGNLVRDAFDYSYALWGLLHVAAAGNSGNPGGGGNNVEYPGRFVSVMAVAATDQNDIRASFSSTGPDVELAAPGVGIVSTYPGGGYAVGSGTSMASPHVAGTAALVMAAYPDWTTTKVRTQLRDTADGLGPEGKDNLYGFGLVDADEAAAPAGNLAPVADAGPDQTVTDADNDGVEMVTLDASASYDADGTITAYEWSESGTVLSTEVSFAHSFSVGAHAVTLTVTDNEGASSTDGVIIEVREAAAYPTVTVNIDMSLETRKAGPNVFTTAVATVSIVDSNGAPVEGATVSGNWSGLTGDSDSGVTDTAGLVMLRSDQVKKANGSFTFTVVSVTKGEADYELSGETSDSISVP